MCDRCSAVGLNMPSSASSIPIPDISMMADALLAPSAQRFEEKKSYYIDL